MNKRKLMKACITGAMVALLTVGTVMPAMAANGTGDSIAVTQNNTQEVGVNYWDTEE